LGRCMPRGFTSPENANVSSDPLMPIRLADRGFRLDGQSGASNCGRKWQVFQRFPASVHWCKLAALGSRRCPSSVVPCPLFRIYDQRACDIDAGEATTRSHLVSPTRSHLATPSRRACGARSLLIHTPRFWLRNPLVLQWRRQLLPNNPTVNRNASPHAPSRFRLQPSAFPATLYSV
jgi:hypothetical protein